MLKKDNTYPNKLKKENKIILLEEYKGSNKHHKMQCLVCKHIWSATPKSKIQNKKKFGKNGCPNCKIIENEKEYKLTRTKNINMLKERGIVVLDDWDGRRHLKNENTYSKITVKNVNCGHIFDCSPTNLLTNGVVCAICGPQKRVEPLIQWSKENSKKWQETATEWEIYRNTVHSLTRLVYNENKQKINPKNLLRGKAGIEGAYHLDHIVPVRFCFDNNIPEELCASIINLQMVKWEDNINSKASIKGTLPPLFLPYVESGKRIEKFANELKNKIFPKGEIFKIIDDISLTLYDKESNIGIVIIPLDKSYANMKTANISMNIMIKNNIRPFIIFEDELKKDFIINKLLHYIGKSPNDVLRIHARKCTIQKIDPKTKKQFLNKFHIQGSDRTSISYGAFYEDELVSVMTFGKPRVLLGYKSSDRSVYDYIWELSRFATNITYRIPGIAGKLLETFKRENKWDKIISYADKRWSVGNLYDKLGFIMEESNKPDYFYIIEGQRRHRWNYRKDKLKETMNNYDPKLTEYQNMENAGYWRLWDCGTFRYVMYNL